MPPKKLVLERLLVAINGYKNVYETDLFTNAILKVEQLSGVSYGKEKDIT